MDKIPLAIVGCGGMGHRHLYGLAELHNAGLSPFELVGACDPVRANAESLADDAEERLGTRPQVVESMEELEALGVVAVDITTTPRYHHTVAEEAIARGWHAMIEKPVGLTVRASNRIQQAAERSDSIVSVAENYRRDPMNRLGKALLEAGVIGSPRLMIHNTMGGSDLMLITVWRHQKNQSGVLLDVGVHFTDIIEYYLGPAVPQSTPRPACTNRSAAIKPPSPAGARQATLPSSMKGGRSRCRRSSKPPPTTPPMQRFFLRAAPSANTSRITPAMARECSRGRFTAPRDRSICRKTAQAS